jgi:hypothetical protein
MTHNITTLSIMTPVLHCVAHAECHDDVCCMLNVIVLTVIMLNFVMLKVIMPIVMMLSAIIIQVVMLWRLLKMMQF